MLDWLPSLLIFGGVVLTVAGGIVGSILTSRVGAKANANAALANRQSGENNLIDQLQEELKRYRESADARATGQDERMNQMAPLVDGYRDYAHELRAHIYDRKEPPPPPWPNGLPR